MAFNKKNYRFIVHTPKNSDVKEIIALSSYCGRVVKGSAKCDPRDSFDAEKGETLAALRCYEKVAKKRVKNANDKVAEAQAKIAAAQKELEKAVKYQAHANGEYSEAEKMLVEFIETLA